MTTPHRGSPIPHNPLISRAIRFIQMPRTINRRDRRVLVEAIREELRGLFTLPANSIRFLKSGSPVLEAIETLPLAKDIPYHSIIGDRGKGDSPNSTDGVVPYWSSHLETAASEKIVPSNHSAPQNPETAQEIRRLLIEAAGSRPIPYAGKPHKTTLLRAWSPATFLLVRAFMMTARGGTRAWIAKWLFLDFNDNATCRV